MSYNHPKRSVNAMATNLEILSHQKKLLLRLLKIKSNGVKDAELNMLIKETKASLSKEEVKWVESCITEED
jgi:hypothetical protein